ncbi:hypothetical protein ACFRFH_02310 [Leifsonia sp. NPDC056824]|uniref:hypothetical protein n=1 Tax=Leifsonia sp. NPDC056824 TaxID=3345953 RepID=UPI0036C216FF
MYVDECKAKGYYIAAAVVMPHDAAALDRTIRTLNRPGQRRIHFTKESDSSKRKLISEVLRLELTVVVYQVRGQPDRAARPLCIDALVDDLVTAECAHLILERDASLEKADRQMIAAALDRNGGYALRYEHTAPNDHALLWISDMVAWCCYKGGEWHRRVQPMIADIKTLAP